MAQYCRDLWAKHSDMLVPLTALVGECGHTKVTKVLKTKKVPWHWDEVHQKAFNDVKAIIARDVALAYPDYSKEFEIYTDASSRQMGAVITQKNRPIEFFSRKLSTTQQKYSGTEIGLLTIVETLKELCCGDRRLTPTLTIRILFKMPLASPPTKYTGGGYSWESMALKSFISKVSITQLQTLSHV